MSASIRHPGLTGPLLITAGVALTAALLFSSPASAEERTCRGSLGEITVDNLRVPQDARCELNGTRIQGTLKVERAATLVAREIRVIGNVQGENARRVAVRASRVGGSVQVVQGGSALVRGTRIKQDILYDENRARVKSINNVLDGSIQVFQNRGGVRIVGNNVDGNLQCKGNNPRPTGGNNVVQGNKQDQCARL
jgi:hypothetical protein